MTVSGVPPSARCVCVLRVVYPVDRDPVLLSAAPQTRPPSPPPETAVPSVPVVEVGFHREKGCFRLAPVSVRFDYIQWGEQVFDTLPILQVFLLTKHVEVCNYFIIGTLQL